jgi:predicted nucleic acid-binding Zn ribbon protein
MKRREDRPHPLAEDLDQALRKLGADPDIVPLAVLQAWPGVVGEHAAQKTQPVRLVRGRLTVHTTSEVWVTEILADQTAILTRLARAAPRPRVESLHVRVGDVVPVEPPGKPLEPKKPGTVPPEIDALLRTVEDPALRESIRRAVGLSLGKR